MTLSLQTPIPATSMVHLIGPGGAGKSTVGPVLAARLGCAFYDLDREFERKRGDIDAFIGTHGYEAYARENVSVYLELSSFVSGAVLALSSGFMVYRSAVHSEYATVRDATARDAFTFVLLPSLDRETCVTEIVRRQLARPSSRRDASREAAVIRERFERYVGLPATKIESIPSAHEVAVVIHDRIAVDRLDRSARN